MKQNQKVAAKSSLNWDAILNAPSPEIELQESAQMLMFRFLAEVEKYQVLHGLKRKDLAKKIGTSASYLTQIFRGDKPLNFLTIAKMQKELGIKFYINAQPLHNEVEITDESFWYDNFKKYHSGKGHWCFYNSSQTKADQSEDIYNNIVKLTPSNKIHDNEAIPA